MNRPKKPPPRRLAEREGESKLTASRVPSPETRGKPFDALEKKLSIALDGLLDAIDTYRELKR